jgi:predicted outer membrane protein
MCDDRGRERYEEDCRAIGAGLLMLVTGQAMAQISPADRTFATKAAAGGEAEVGLGRLATEKAGSGQVRQFG